MAAALSCPKCKKTLRTANPLPAGKKVKCPSCEAVFTVPEPKAAPTAETAIKKPAKSPAAPPPPVKKPAAPAAKTKPTKPTPPTPKAKPPAPPAKSPRRPQPEPEDELEDQDEDTGFDDDDDQDERPARRGKKASAKGGGSMLFILAGAGVAVLALVAVGAFVWPGFLLSPTSPRPNLNSPIVPNPVDQTKIGNPPIAATSPLLTYLPADSYFVAGIKPSSPLLKKIILKAYSESFPENAKDMPEPESIVGGGSTVNGIVVIQTVSPFDKTKIKELTKATDIPGKNFYQAPDGRGYLGMPTDRIIVVGGGKWVEADFEQALASQQARLNAELLAQVAAVQNSTVWMVAANKGEINQQLGGMPADVLEQQAPGAKDALPAAQRAKFVRVSAELPPGAGVNLSLALVCADEMDAKKLSDLGNDFWNKQGKAMLPLVGAMAGQQAKIDLSSLLTDVTNSFQLGNNAEVLTASLQLSDKTLKDLEKIPLPGEGSGGLAELNTLKQLAIAMHSYHDLHRKLPGAASYTPDGKPLLSWRVHLLPFLEQNNLYNQFDLTAAWDDPKNLALLQQMPKVFATPGRSAPPGQTYYQVFVADEDEPRDSSPIFRLGKDSTTDLLRIADGTSNTILIAEAEQAVPWTKPEDMRYSAKLPVPKLGNPQAGHFNVVMADGSVSRIQRIVDEANLRRAIMAADGTELPPDWQSGAKGEPLPILPKTNEPPEKKKDPDPLPKVDPPKFDPEAKVDPDAKSPLHYMPAFVDTIAGVDLDNVRTNPLTAPLFEMARAPIEGADKNAWEFLKNWQLACVGGSITEQNKGVLFVRTKNPVSEDELKKGANVLNTKQVAGLNYFEVQIGEDKAWLTRLDDRHLLLAKLSEDDFTELLLPLGSSRFDAELDKQIARVSKATFWAVASNKGMLNDSLMMLKADQLTAFAPELVPLLPTLQGSKFFPFWCQLQKDQLDINIGLAAASKDEAENVRAKADEFWKTKGKGLLLLASAAIPKTPGFNAAPIIDEASNSLQFKADGNLAYATVTFTKTALDELQNAARGLGGATSAIPKLDPASPLAPNAGNGADLAKLQGKWQLASIEANGQKQNATGAFAKTFSITGDKLFGMAVFAMDMKIDDGKQPKWIDFSVTQGGNAIVSQGIYELGETEFKFCVSAPMAARPDSFDTRGKQVQLFITRKVTE